MGLKIKNIQISCVLQGQAIPSAWSEGETARWQANAIIVSGKSSLQSKCCGVLQEFDLTGESAAADNTRTSSCLQECGGKGIV